MGPKKGRIVRQIETPTDSVPEFELGDTVANIQRRREERGTREREEAQQQREEEASRVEARAEETYSQEERLPEKRPRSEKSDIEAGGEVGPSQVRYKKGHMTNIYLTDSDEEAIVDFVKDHEDLYKTNEHFKNIARKECLWEQFANSCKLYVKV